MLARKSPTSYLRQTSNPGRAMGSAVCNHRSRPTRTTQFFEQTLASYRDVTNRALLELIPEQGPPYLYQLVSVYPRRSGKGLRAALCFAACAALGGTFRQALNSAIAIEL